MSIANKDIILKYHDLVFNKHCPREAAELYIGELYVQHNPMAKQGKDYFIHFFNDFFKENPEFSVKVVNSAAEGDLVFLHVHAKRGGWDAGEMVVDIYRLADGKIQEHWDVIQKVDKYPINPRAFF